MYRIWSLALLATLGLPTIALAQPDPMESRARAKSDRPWFAQFMSGDPVVAGFPGESEADRTKRVQRWKDAKFGLFLHWGPQKAGGESVISDEVLSNFNPVKFDAEDWVLTAKKLGFRYIVITTKHHSGFCMFDSQYTQHDIIDATPFGRDPMKELADACSKHDMLLGFYYSVWDIKHPDYTANLGSPKYANYHQYMLDQTTELLTNYGPIVTLWMDGEWVNTWSHERASEYRDHVRKLQPDILLVDRIGQRRLGDGDYGSCENFTPYIGDNINHRLWESCQRFDGGWFWKGKDTSQSMEWALLNLVDTVSRGGNLLMNMGPTPEGELPPVSVAKLKPLGDWLRKYGESIYGVERGPHYLLEWGTCTRRNNTLYYQIAQWPKDGRLVIPGLNEGQPDAGIHQITFLGDSDAAPLKFTQSGSDVVVSVPRKPVDPLMSVIKVELKRPPVVDNPIRPLSRPLRPQQGNADVSVGDYFLSSAFAEINGDDLHFSLGAGAGGQRENLKGWTNPSDWAQWEIVVDEPGSYEIKINYSSWMDSGKFAVKIAGQTFEHDVTAGVTKRGRLSPFKAAFKVESLGEVQFETPGRYTLMVKALEIDPQAVEWDQGLMLLREVILTPAR
ncbi:alpha-L-fucosidase [Aporhodopirellula aestuarii]|uniref:alpha-L-fucosidase n=1 Tax=Aporhodopirellula aestuarii TaxID=2950107 RepID=A0ABT0TYD6_9BACT|nr:alpha-L-fucosidase [Aporhodopirellula aestuarii]MCM2369617.1 alpha-L-fucosidase [Aporhodopirellula aestuarii]